jgi:FAD/FMN-containing dehydrogenase
MGTDRLPERRPADGRCVAEIADRLSPARVSRDPDRRREASRDHAWLSPVLTSRLPDVLADVVVAPLTDGEVAAVLGIAHRRGVAVTARGRGTGNYGQAVPLAAGVVIDTSDLRGVLDVGDGWIHARAGTSFTRLEAAARATGQELAMFPSTTASALAGFLGGGAGGTGSLENGFIWDGYVHELDLLPCWDEPEARRVDAKGALPHLHAYGTTGIVTAARVALRPARDWFALFASFPTFTDTAAAGRAILALEPAPRNCSVDDPALVPLLGSHPAMPPGRASLRATVERSTAAAASRAVVDHGGTVELVDPGGGPLLVALSFNHVTLRAKRADARLCHLQVGGPALVDRHEDVRAAVPGALLHLDAMAADGARGFGGLLLSPFRGEEALADAGDRLRALGVRVIEAHSWTVGDRGMLAATRAAAADLDPAGLLNPGKLDRGPVP